MLHIIYKEKRERNECDEIYRPADIYTMANAAVQKKIQKNDRDTMKNEVPDNQ